MTSPPLRRHFPPLRHFLVQHLRQQERQLERLAGVEAGVAVGVVAGLQVGFAHVDHAAGAFGDVLAGHLAMDAAGEGAFGAVDGEEAADFVEDAVEGASLVAVGGLDDVAVHRIAAPDDRMPLALHCADEGGEGGLDPVVPVAGDERHPAGRARGVERIEQAQQRVGIEAGAALHPDRVADAAQELDMRAAFEPGAVADPEHVRAGIVPLAGQAVLPRERLFIGEQQRFVAGVEIGGVELGHAIGIDAAGGHELERFADAIGDVGEARGPRALAHEIERPFVDLMQIGVAAGGEGAQQVERRRGLAVALNHPLGIGNARFGSEGGAVDIVAAIAGQLHAADRLGRASPSAASRRR